MAASLLFGAICSALAWYQAFRFPDSLPFDSREQLIWMWRFVDPALLPGDPLADYLASVEPPGVGVVYRAFATIGIDPFTAAKVLPGLLGLFATWHAHRLGAALSGLRHAGLVTAIFVNLAMWLAFDLTTGTARAFVYPLMPWFLSAAVRGRAWQAAVAIVALAMCYPPVAALLVTAFGGWAFLDPASGRSRTMRMAAIAAALASLLIVLPQIASANAFGPLLTAVEGRGLDELQDGGEFPFFVTDRFAYWVTAFRTGVATYQFPITLLFAATLPAVVLLSRRSGIILPQARLLFWLLGSSMLFWTLAHLLLFRLYQPSRYTMHTLRVIAAAATAIAVAWCIDVLRTHRGAAATAVAGAVMAAAIFPFARHASIRGFPENAVVVGKAPLVYEWLRRSERGTVVASLSPESNNIPALTARTSLTGSDFGLPWHTGYHRGYRQRTADVITAHFTADLGQFQALVERHRIAVFLIERNMFDAAIVERAGRRWLRPFDRELRNAAGRLRGGETPVLAAAPASCHLVDDGPFTLIDARCTIRALRARASPIKS